MKQVTASFLILFLFLLGVNGVSYKEIRQRVLKDYDRNARPVKDTDTPTKVAFGYNAIKLIEIDETTNQMTFLGWIKMKWKDEYVFWSSTKDAGMVTFSADELWTPDIMLYNGKSSVIRTYLLGSSDGTALWVPPITTITDCDIKPTLDTQKCNITFGSWTQSQLQLELSVEEANVQENLINDHPLWSIKVIDTAIQSKFYNCCKEPYVSITYTVNLERRSNCKSILFFPSLSLCVLLLSMFLISPKYPMKLALGSIVLVSQLILMSIETNGQKTLPHESTVFPSNFVIALALVAQLFSLLISKIKTGASPKELGEKLSSTFVGKIFCINFPINLLVKTEISEDDWIILSYLLDRFFFVCFLIIIIVQKMVY